jgi:1-deoxy-D-xylulose-5-phosphate synthase
MDLLNRIDSPKDLRLLHTEFLPQVADELRQFIIDTITKTGGHFGGNLGVVELTLALHYVFDTPQDRLIWDIGHQTYPHKILTGRRDRLATIRKTNGLAPFLQRQESEHDHFGAGHTSTSLSAALGMAVARDQQGQSHKVVAIIGDGAMTGGMAFEALNNIGAQGSDMIIVLNDNQMSIDPNCGALCQHFDDLVHKRTALNVFESFGLRYDGPYDGHDLQTLVRVLKKAKDRQGPWVVHVRTEKGRGYAAAKDDSQKCHAMPEGAKKDLPQYNKVFGQTIVDIAEKDPSVVAITPAMCSGSAMNDFAKRFPERFFDVAIAEQHAVTFAAGLAKEGLKPFCTIYSTFLQRGYDQLIHDVCIQNLPVRFFLDRGGLVGGDGATHHGLYDMAYMRTVPNMVIASPRDEAEFVSLIHTAHRYDQGPIAVRYPRGYGHGVTMPKEVKPVEIGKGELLRDGDAAVIVGVGPWLADAVAVADTLLTEGVRVAVIDARFVKPLDEELLARFAHIHEWITLEDHSITGGLGGAVSEWISSKGLPIRLQRLGVPDRFIEHGSVDDLRALCGADRASIRAAIIHSMMRQTIKTNASYDFKVV